MVESGVCRWSRKQARWPMPACEQLPMLLVHAMLCRYQTRCPLLAPPPMAMPPRARRVLDYCFGFLMSCCCHACTACRTARCPYGALS